MRRLPILAVLLVLAGCAGSRVQAPSGPPPAPSTEAGHASFFFPIEIPLADLRRILDESLPRHLSDEKKQEISETLRDDFYRYTLDRGDIAVGLAGELLTFEIPVRGSLTLGGRLRPVPLGKGLPVQETVDFSGTIRGTASPAITPDWRPDPRPTAQIHLAQARLRALEAFSVGVRPFLEERLNPILNRELQKAAGEMLDGLALRKRAEAVWKSLHVSRRVQNGENLWLRFEPADMSLAPITASETALRTGIGISGRISMTLGQTAPPAALSPLPPLRLNGVRSAGFEVEIPVMASAEELSRTVDRELKGDRFRIAGTKRLTITAASLQAEEDRLRIDLDFQEQGARPGRLIVRGRPVVDPQTNILSLEDLQYDLTTGGRFLKLMDRFRRAEMLEKLKKETRLDLTPYLDKAGRETAQALRSLLPPGTKGEVSVSPVRILGVGVADGAIWARCRLTGTTSALTIAGTP
ncbi:MAG TPA: DUF4403 family protein [Thermoanaerobaculia bacterium]